MATLFLCHRLPFPPNKGDKIRSHALLAHLAQLGPVHVGAFIDEKTDLQYRDDVRALAGGDCMFIPLSSMAKWARAVKALVLGKPITTSYFASRPLSRWVKDILATNTIDNIVIFGSAMAPLVLNQKTDGARALFDMVDIDSDKWRQYAAASRFAAKWVYEREARALENLERRAARHFGKTLLVSPFEAESFRLLAPESAAKIQPLNNGVDLERFSPGDFANPFLPNEVAIVMTGRMDYRPNFTGAIWCAEQVWPHIFSRLPKAHVYFVGANPPASLRRLASPAITVTGAVDDVRPYLQHAAAVIAPLQMARGVQNKVLEAMAMQKAIVATQEATRALAVENERHLWIENEPERFADAVVAAVLSPQRATVMQNARRYVEENHTWKKVFLALDDHLDELKAKSSPQTEPASPVQTVSATSWFWRRKEAEV